MDPLYATSFAKLIAWPHLLRLPGASTFSSYLALYDNDSALHQELASLPAIQQLFTPEENTPQTVRRADALVNSDWLVPIPLKPERLVSRGYNQAWELVKALRARVSAPPKGLADALVRLGEAPDQHRLPREQRLRNLRGAFAAAPQHIEEAL